MNVYVVVSGTEDNAKIFNGFAYAGVGKFKAKWSPLCIEGDRMAPVEAVMFPSWAEAEMVQKEYGGTMLQVSIEVEDNLLRRVTRGM